MSKIEVKIIIISLILIPLLYKIARYYAKRDNYDFEYYCKNKAIGLLYSLYMDAFVFYMIIRYLIIPTAIFIIEI